MSIWLPTLGQLLLVNRQLATRIEPGRKAYEFKTWITTALPILMVEGFYSLLAYTDVLVLQYFRPPDEVAVYYAAAKTLALVSFIYYSIVGHHRAPLQQLSRRRRPRRAVRLHRPIHQMDVLAVARGDRAAARCSGGRCWACSAPSSPTAIT